MPGDGGIGRIAGFPVACEGGWADGCHRESLRGVSRVVVEAGDHTIEMRYRPWSVFYRRGDDGDGDAPALWIAAHG